MKEKEAKLDLQIKLGKDLSAKEYAAIVALCTQAFELDYTPHMKSFVDPTHVIGWFHHKLVSHVLWITRWLQIGTAPLLRTAYIEALATEISYRNRGFASQLMRKAAAGIQDYGIAALSTGSHGFYARLGWQLWRGPLYARKGKELIAMPQEQGCVMVYSLPQTPPLDIASPLSVEWRELEPW
jgi:aminoglycoside 2'-N-acetyltransferase I